MNTKNLQIAQKTARLLLSIQAVTFRFDPPYTYTNGLKSPIYLDNRLVMSYPKVRDEIIKLYIQTIKNNIGLKNIDVISATATAAIPQGAWVAYKLNLPMVFVRPSTKTYGKGNKMEGTFAKKSKVVIIEDHISTAASVVGNVETIRELGGIAKYAVATTSYETEIAKKTVKDLKIKLFTLTTGKVILEEALKRNYITEKEKKAVDLWFKDPQNWWKRVSKKNK
jgi:orotate phosphoribosyltransferase